MPTQPLTDEATEAVRRPARRASEGVDERRLLEGLRRRDEDICRTLIQAHHETMVRIARGYVGSRAVAEEVAQEAWVAMFRGLAGFEGRSSLRSWLFSILIHRARTVGARERRSQAVSQLVLETEAETEDPVEALFYREDHSRAGSWALPPQRWRIDPQDRALNAETKAWLSAAIAALPDMQRLVVTLRDVEGWDTSEVALALGRTSNWVRVTLHRARFKVRLAIGAKLGIED